MRSMGQGCSSGCNYPHPRPQARQRWHSLSSSRSQLAAAKRHTGPRLLSAGLDDFGQVDKRRLGSLHTRRHVRLDRAVVPGPPVIRAFPQLDHPVPGLLRQ